MFKRATHIVVLFLLPLCAGAVWSMAVQVLHRDLPWFPVLLALTLLLMRGQLQFVSTPTRALLHLAAVCVALVYAQTLIAGVAMAAPLGHGLFEALQLMGVEMTLALIVERSDAIDSAGYVASLLLASWIGCRTDPVKPRSVP